MKRQGHHVQPQGADKLGFDAPKVPKGTCGKSAPLGLDYWRKQGAVGVVGNRMLRIIIKQAFERIDQLESRLRTEGTK